MGAVNSCAAQHGGGYLLQAITNGDDLAFRRVRRAPGGGL